MKLLICLLSTLLFISCLAGGNSGYVKCSDDEIQNDDMINRVLKHGVAYIFKHAANKYGISLDNIDITKINSISKQESKGETNYKCDVVATNNNDATIEATFTVEVNHNTGNLAVRKWKYQIEYKSQDKPDKHDDCDQVEVEVDVDMPEEDNEIELGSGSWEPSEPEDTEDTGVTVDVEGESGVEVEVDVNVENNEGEVQVDIEVTVQLPEDAIKNDDLLNEVLRYGTAYIFERAAEKYGVSQDNLEITQINTVQRVEQDEGDITITVEVNATNNDDATVDASFTVDVNPDTREKNVREWRYTIEYQSNGEAETAVDAEDDTEEYNPDDEAEVNVNVNVN